MGLIFKENVSTYSFDAYELVFRVKKSWFGLKKENVLSIVEKHFHGFEDGTESLFNDLVKNIPSDWSFNWINFSLDYYTTFYVPINVSTHDKIIKNLEDKKQIIIEDNYCGFFNTESLVKDWINPDENTNYYILKVRAKNFTVLQLPKNNVLTLVHEFKFDLFRDDIENPKFNYLNKNTNFFEDNKDKIIELLTLCKIPFRYN